MKRIVGSIVVVAVVVFGFTSIGESQQAGITRTELARGVAGSDYTASGAKGTDVVTMQITFEPGSTAAWHTHPGGETAVFTAGTLTIFMADDPKCEGHEYKAGEVFLGKGKVVHQAKNLGKDPVQAVITYFDVPAGGQVASPAERPKHCKE